MDLLIAKPFLKWAGGKTQLLSEIEKRLPQDELKCYFEPFVGSGAVVLHLAQKLKTLEKIYINDRNPELILVWNVVKYFVDDLIEELKNHQEEYSDEEKRKSIYNSKRKLFNDGISGLDEVNFYDFKLNNQQIIKYCIERAGLFIFLNKTCFNGLYRVNKKGQFNVPKGNYKNPKILDEKNLRAVSRILNYQMPEFIIMPPSDYKIIYDEIQKLINNGYKANEFLVYFDPPYLPISTSSSFTSYSKFDFTKNDQVELASFFKTLDLMNIHVMLSNSDPTNVNKDDLFFDNLYSDFAEKIDEKGIKRVGRVLANRNINSKGTGRGKITEILVTNSK
ncbi:Type II DNA methyltransferase M1.BstXII [Bacillus sp. X1(2014)]|nr:Type II DNA methyltransferase M1.BstXII [Bacillus sp. X1(2014)]